MFFEFKQFFRPIDQRSIISLTSFVDVLEYVDHLKKRNSSRPNSMGSAGSDVKRPLTVKTASYVGAKSDQLLMAQTFLDVVCARLNPEVK